MNTYLLTPVAKSNIFAIWCYIARHSEHQAEQVEQAIYDACAFVARSPMHGHFRTGLTTRSLRFWTLTRYSNYTVVYRPATTPLQMVAVLNGKRNIRGILQRLP